MLTKFKTIFEKRPTFKLYLQCSIPHMVVFSLSYNILPNLPVTSSFFISVNLAHEQTDLLGCNLGNTLQSGNLKWPLDLI